LCCHVRGSVIFLFFFVIRIQRGDGKKKKKKKDNKKETHAPHATREGVMPSPEPFLPFSLLVAFI
jgi:hypothetical protein